MWSFFAKLTQPMPPERLAEPRNSSADQKPQTEDSLVEKQPLASVISSAPSTEEDLQNDLQSLLSATEQKLLAQILPSPSVAQQKSSESPAKHGSVEAPSAKPVSLSNFQQSEGPAPSSDCPLEQNQIGETEDLLAELESLSSIEPEEPSQSEQELLDELESLLSPPEEELLQTEPKLLKPAPIELEPVPTEPEHLQPAPTVKPSYFDADKNQFATSKPSYPCPSGGSTENKDYDLSAHTSPSIKSEVAACPVPSTAIATMPAKDARIQLALRVLAAMIEQFNTVRPSKLTRTVHYDKSLKKFLLQGPEDDILRNIEIILAEECQAVLGYANTYGEAGMLIQQKNRLILLKCADMRIREGMMEFRRKQLCNATLLRGRLMIENGTNATINIRNMSGHKNAPEVRTEDRRKIGTKTNEKAKTVTSLKTGTKTAMKNKIKSAITTNKNAETKAPMKTGTRVTVNKTKTGSITTGTKAIVNTGMTAKTGTSIMRKIGTHKKAEVKIGTRPPKASVMRVKSETAVKMRIPGGARGASTKAGTTKPRTSGTRGTVKTGVATAPLKSGTRSHIKTGTNTAMRAEPQATVTVKAGQRACAKIGSTVGEQTGTKTAMRTRTSLTKTGTKKVRAIKCRKESAMTKAFMETSKATDDTELYATETSTIDSGAKATVKEDAMNSRTEDIMETMTNISTDTRTNVCVETDAMDTGTMEIETKDAMMVTRDTSESAPSTNDVDDETEVAINTDSIDTGVCVAMETKTKDIAMDTWIKDADIATTAEDTTSKGVMDTDTEDAEKADTEDIKTNLETDTKDTVKTTTTAGTKAAMKAGTKAVVNAGTRHAAKTGTKHAMKTGTKHALKTGTKHAVQTGTKHAVKTGTKHAVKTGTKAATTGISAALKTVATPLGLAADVAQLGLEVAGYEEAGKAVGAGGNIVSGALVGSVFGPVGTLVGGVVGFGVWGFSEIAGSAVGGAVGSIGEKIFSSDASTKAEGHSQITENNSELDESPPEPEESPHDLPESPSLQVNSPSTSPIQLSDTTTEQAERQLKFEQILESSKSLTDIASSIFDIVKTPSKSSNCQSDPDQSNTELALDKSHLETAENPPELDTHGSPSEETEVLSEPTKVFSSLLTGQVESQSQALPT